MPEAREQTARPAGFVSRAAAMAIDLVVLALAWTLTMMLIRTAQHLLIGPRLHLIERGLALLPDRGTTLFAAAYFVTSWRVAGQTVGMRLLGLAVRRIDGRPLNVTTALIRFLGYTLSAPLMLGFLWVLVDPQRQGFHDKLARTVVVYAPRKTRPFVVKLGRGPAG